MDETWRALRAALSTRLAAGAAAIAIAGGLLAGALPLLEVPGLELGLAAALACALGLAPALGLAAARRELARRAGPPSMLRPFAAAAAASLLLLALLFTASALRAAVATPCRPLAGAVLFAVVAVPSALLGCAVAVALGVAARGRRRAAALLYGAVVIASLAVTLLDAYLGPAASAHDHLLGVWPGPLYDEAVPVDARLLLFRAATLAWTGAVLSAGAAWARRRTGASSGPWGLATAAIAAALALRAAGGGAPRRAELASALGGERRGPRCVVHFAREKGPADAERILRDCEYDAAEVARTLGLAQPPRATVWIYRDAEEKRRLVGAGRTSFTKPWLAEIHVQDQGVPHPLLRHELVHALASAVARPPLRVPARAGLLVNAGLVEGLAVAVELPSGDHGVHAWTRALRDRGQLPPLAALLGTAGFFGAAPARAYTAAGSFLRFLLEREGAAAVMAAYREDDVARAVGRPLETLESEWHRFLDGVAVSPALAAAAEARFERGSLFARACAREVAGLEEAAAREARLGRPAAAEAALRRASALSDGDPGYLRGAADAWRAAGDLARAEAVLDEALAAAPAGGARRSLRAGLLAAQGDLRLRAGDGPGAAERDRAAQALGAAGGAEARTLLAKLAAATDEQVGRAAGPWLLGIGDAGVALSRLAQGEDGLSRYLLARARLARGAPALALASLDALRERDLPAASFALEARRMAAEALCSSGRWEDGIAAWRALGATAVGDARREQAEDAARRCAFERDTWRGPVRWEGDWPADRR